MRAEGERRGVDQTHSCDHRQSAEMAASADRSSLSSVSSTSLLDIKAETHLVLRAFLSRSLTVAETDRPGRVGGAYKEYTKYSYKPKPKEGCDSQAEDGSSGDEKKRRLKDLLKISLRTRKTLRDGKNSLGREKKSQLSEEDVLSPSSTSEDEDGEKKMKTLSRKKIKKRLSTFFIKKFEKEKEKEKERDKDKAKDGGKEKEKERDKDEAKDGGKEKDKERENQREKEKDKEGRGPQRPSSLAVGGGTEPVPPLVSPGHSPEFFNDVAQKLEKVAHRSTSIKKVRPSPPPLPAVSEKDVLVKELVSELCAAGDSINEKIESNPFMRDTLSRLSYASFAKVMDAFSSALIRAAPPLPPPATPTLQRMAVSMEVSSQLVTATGTQSLEGYAESYMETFSPWIKSQGGWEGVRDLAEPEEYD